MESRPFRSSLAGKKPPKESFTSSCTCSIDPTRRPPLPWSFTPAAEIRASSSGGFWQHHAGVNSISLSFSRGKASDSPSPREQQQIGGTFEKEATRSAVPVHGKLGCSRPLECAEQVSKCCLGDRPIAGYTTVQLLVSGGRGDDR